MKLKTTLTALFLSLSLMSIAYADVADGWDAYNKGDYKSAVNEWRSSADQGHADAQYILGLMYGEGKGVLKDHKQAVHWYRKAADQGDAQAQYNLGVMYGEGSGVLKDDKQAVQWYRKAADQGYAKAQNNLGVMYANGRGVLKNLTQAKYWIQKAYKSDNKEQAAHAEKIWEAFELWKY
jgi:TPR repeat protein